MAENKYSKPQITSSQNSLMVWVVVLFIVALAALTAGYLFGSNRPQSTPPTNTQPGGVNPQFPNGDEGEGVFCTLDAKICPDGSSVGRTGPNCEFAPCPGQSADVTTYSNPTMGVTFQYPVEFSLLEDTATNAVFGTQQMNYLQVSTTPSIDAANLPMCVEHSTVTCIENAERWGQIEAVEQRVIGHGTAARSFYVAQGGNSEMVTRYIQTLDGKFEMRMFVSEDGLDEKFKQVVRTLQFSN